MAGRICGMMRRSTEVDTKSPGRQNFCAKISDNAHLEELPGHCA